MWLVGSCALVGGILRQLRSDFDWEGVGQNPGFFTRRLKIARGTRFFTSAEERNTGSHVEDV